MWQEGFVQALDTRFHSRTLGTGDDVLVLLHGWPQDGSVWREIAPPLVAEGWRVVCPDLKGFGRSDAPRKGYDAETVAAEMAQLIASLDVEDAVLVGHDWGGIVALQTAIHQPQRVRALGIVSAPYRRIDLRRAWHIPLFNVPVVPELLFGSPSRSRRVAGLALKRASARRAGVAEDALDRYGAAIAAHPHGWLAYYRGMSRQAVVRAAQRLVRSDTSSARPELRMPTTVVWGADDPVTPAALARRDAEDLGARFVEIPGAGHFLPEEAPDELVREILAIAASARSSPPAGS